MVLDVRGIILWPAPNILLSSRQLASLSSNIAGDNETSSHECCIFFGGDFFVLRVLPGMFDVCGYVPN